MCSSAVTLWHCMEACHALGRVRRGAEAVERTEETRLGSAVEFGGSKTRLAIRPKRTSKRNVSRREKPKTGQLISLL